MSVYSDVRAGIRRGALAALSEYPDHEVIFSHTNSTEPSQSYVVINILSVEQQGRQSNSTMTSLVDNQEVQTITASYEVYVQFSFIGSLSGEMSSSFNQRLGSNPIVEQEFRRNKLGFLRKSQVRRAPQKRETKWVEYHNLDAYFSYSAITQQVVDIIETVILQDLITGEVYTVPPTPITIP